VRSVDELVLDHGGGMVVIHVTRSGWGSVAPWVDWPWRRGVGKQVMLVMKLLFLVERDSFRVCSCCL